LVVDDTAVDRKLAGRLLEKAPGIQVLYADGGQAALELLQSECVDLIVTDLQMPDMDGLQLLTAIQEHSSEIPVVLMTAHGSEDIASLALEHGAVSFVPKAHLADLLADTVVQILAWRTMSH
jgi:DNA-binding NtrC family response regulator